MTISSYFSFPIKHLPYFLSANPSDKNPTNPALHSASRNNASGANQCPGSAAKSLMRGFFLPHCASGRHHLPFPGRACAASVCLLAFPLADPASSFTPGFVPGLGGEHHLAGSDGFSKAVSVRGCCTAADRACVVAFASDQTRFVVRSPGPVGIAVAVADGLAW